MILTNFPPPTPLESKLGLVPIDTDFPDMQIARIELRRGVHEFSGSSKNNPEIMKYFGAVSLPKAYQIDETPWCAIFESWIDKSAGVACKASTAAVDFAKQGSPVKKESIQYGDRCVRSRTGGHHVHRFVAHADDGGYWALGGNQSNSVCIAHYTWDAVIAINRPDRSGALSSGEPSPVSTKEITLRRGDNGLQVSSLQTRLKELGLVVTVDGVFGPATEKAVKAFQKSNMLLQDGIVGPKTAQALAPRIDTPSSQPETPVVKNPTTPPKFGTQVMGIDVSHWEPKTDMAQIKRAGLSFVGMKCTQGVTVKYDDPKFNEFWAAAKANGLLRYAYCFMDANADGAAQADHLLARMGMPQAGDLPPCLDWERDDGQTWDHQCKVAMDFCERMKERTGLKRIILYLPSHTMKEHKFPDYFNDHIIWVVHYPKATTPPLAKPFTHWEFWQQNDDADQHGIPSGGDMNLFNGTLEQLKSLTVQP